MKPTFVLGMCLGVSLTLAAQASPLGSARIVESYGKLPLAFEANQGQSDPQVKFLSRGAGYSLFFTSNEAVLALHEAPRQEPALPGAKARTAPEKTSREIKSAVLRMKLVESNAKTEVTGQEELPGKSNYFIGNDPKKWHTNVRQFGKVRYKNVYPGVDLVYYGHQRELEYDFVVQPGVNPQAIRLGIEGARTLRIERGDLVLTSAAGEVHLRSPHIYQETNGVRQEVRGRYVITRKNEVGFEVAAYDHRRELVIDPVLAYSTNLGGSSFDAGHGIAVDAAGNAYVTGVTDSADFPIANAFESTNHGAGDAFVTKFNADGSALVYSTYLGGRDVDIGNGIAVDAAGNAYVAGVTFSTDFPMVNAIQPTNRGSTDVFVTKINAAGSALVYSTYLGGSHEDGASGIALDSVGNAYIVGSTDSADFPMKNAFQSNCGCEGMYVYDAFVAKINAAGTALTYSTYLGGVGVESGNGIAVDSSGRAYVTGWTTSTDFPTKNAIQATYGGGQYDAFLTKIGAAGALLYSTFLGGNDRDTGSAVAVDSSGNAYLTGWTQSLDFPLANPFQPTMGSCCSSAFVTKINAQGNALVYSSYLGGAQSGQGIAVDTGANVYIVGITGSTDFPIVNAIQPVLGGGSDAFVTEVNAQGSTLLYSTYLGGSDQDQGLGIAVDAAGSAYVTGSTGKHFPKTPLALQSFPNPGGEAFVTKIAQQTFVALSTAKVGFPKTVLGTTSTKKLTVTNRGSSTLPINKIFFGGRDTADFAETNNCDGMLAASASCTISITFTPTKKNNRQAGIGISSSDPGSPNAIPVSGIGTVVSLSPSNLAFGDQTVATTSLSQTVTLTNVGSAQLNFTGISITGTNAADFHETNACGTSIAAHASCKISVTFTPTAIGKRTAAVSIGDDGGGSPQEVTLSGIGTTAKLSPTSLTFSAQLVGTTSPAKTVTLTNVGTTSLSITGIAITGTNAGNFAQTHTCGSSLAAKASCTLSVTFKPTAPGARSAALSISDSAAGSPQTVALSGTGEVSGPNATLSPASLTFADQLVGTTSQAKSVKLTNYGTATLSITSITASGDFSQTHTCGLSLAPLAGCTINITFKPTQIGTRTGTLSIADNAPGSPQTVALSGTGVVSGPNATLSPTSLLFACRNIVGDGCECITLKTTTLSDFGTTTLGITGIGITGAAFSQTNNCDASLGSGKSCTITVKWSPPSSSFSFGTVSVSDNASGSPQTVSLEGLKECTPP